MVLLYSAFAVDSSAKNVGIYTMHLKYKKLLYPLLFQDKGEDMMARLTEHVTESSRKKSKKTPSSSPIKTKRTRRGKKKPASSGKK